MPPSPAPSLQLERAEELDLLDMHGTSARVSGDRNTPSPLVPVSPPVVTFEIPEHSALLNVGDQIAAGHVRSPMLGLG
jgi:hypothetical protein